MADPIRLGRLVNADLERERFRDQLNFSKNKFDTLEFSNENLRKIKNFRQARHLEENPDTFLFLEKINPNLGQLRNPFKLDSSVFKRKLLARSFDRENYFSPDFDQGKKQNVLLVKIV